MSRKIKFKIIYSLLLIILITTGIKVKADDPNMDGGGSGGGTQDGTSDNYYSSGDDGVRITVLDTSTGMRAEGTRTVDYYRKNKSEKVIIHFGKVCKLEYMGLNGYTSAMNLQQSNDDYLIDKNGITVAYQVEELPTIVSSSLGDSDIDEIKDYFDDKSRLDLIATRVGMSYDQMINGNYKIIIEPVIYLTFNSMYMAMTAHEAAKLDMALGGTSTTGGALRAKFVSFTHKNLPLAIFLKKDDLGVKKWEGSKEDRVDNGDILEYLGIGILSFEPTEVEVTGGDYTYRPDTDVISAVEIGVGSSGNGATSDNPITVQFSGEYISTTQVTGVVIPPGGSRLVWIKWHTPDVTEETDTTIYVYTTGGTNTSGNLAIIIKPIVQKEPSNPKANDKKPSGWTDSTLPTFPKLMELKAFSNPVKSLSWHTYTCTKRSVWTGDYYTDEEGNEYKIYKTVYDFTTNNYSASLNSTNAVITPDKTTEPANSNSNVIKSGYGIELRVTSNISGTSSSVTGIQNAVTYFPEFEYKTYRRIGTLPGAALSSTIEFPINQYSIYKSRIHFLPIWFPDKEYKVYIETLDAWTPAGMLCDAATASITVKGSMWDDVHIAVLPND